MNEFDSPELVDQPSGPGMKPAQLRILDSPLSRQLVQHQLAVPAQLYRHGLQIEFAFARPRKETFQTGNQRLVLGLVVGAIAEFEAGWGKVFPPTR